ncbi:A/G-specific adenine glycosylase [Zeaxanthinibacter sp. PT1]|uniref:A/G-specific adenine glycosylase n=1 Tax=Zeaxanthinibacter TaxID=561554 RepID=UPI0023499A81|nr:A/G-specific adenine glycosylase [Zeaxanthinibacter sp. PT1]MDC6351072.1 A/G-specific adenine glycosylase [Zeaxanthinibacter sp. PT1]
MLFSSKIIEWYRANKRDLPWRNTRDPYKIWLSEIMLQQTRVVQGLPYYELFLEHFPTVDDLADASEKKVLKLWQGLGYYSRARNLHTTAKTISRDNHGKFPDTYPELKKLKGVGDYTASAIASIAFDRPEPVVDGNVYRVLSRYFGVSLPVNSTEGIKYFKELAREVMDPERAAEYNQALMEFGALQCSPRNPACDTCPLNASCMALEKKMVGELPVKIKKTKVRNRYFNYLVLLDEKGKTRLQQRDKKGIWQQLYEFPLVESEEVLEQDSLYNKVEEVFPGYDLSSVSLENEEPIVHKLSHQHLYTRFWRIDIPGELERGIPLEELDEYPVPVLIADYIKTLKNSYF